MIDQSKADNLLYHLKEIGEVVGDGAGGDGLMVTKVEPYWFTIQARTIESGQVSLSAILPMYGGNGPAADEMFVDAARCALANVIAKKHHIRYINTGHPYHRFVLDNASEENTSWLISAVREWRLFESDSRIKTIATAGEKSLEALVSILL